MVLLCPVTYLTAHGFTFTFVKAIPHQMRSANKYSQRHATDRRRTDVGWTDTRAHFIVPPSVRAHEHNKLLTKRSNILQGKQASPHERNSHKQLEGGLIHNINVNIRWHEVTMGFQIHPVIEQVTVVTVLPSSNRYSSKSQP